MATQGTFFLCVFWGWTVARSCGFPVFTSPIFGFIAVIPIWREGIVKFVTIALSVSLILAASSLSGLDPSHQVFNIFSDFEFFDQFQESFLIPCVCIFSKFVTLYLLGSLRKYAIVMTGLVFSACFGVRKLSKTFLRSPFTFANSCLSAFLHVAHGSPLNYVTFLVSLFLSLPRFPLSVPPQRFTFDNVKSIVYVVVMLIINGSSIAYGMKYHALGMVSDGMMSMCNCAAIVGSVVADIASRMPPSKRFSYGFKRAKVLCDLAVTVLMCYMCCYLVSTSVESLLGDDDEGADADMWLFYLAIIGFIANLAGAFVLGSIDVTTCGCGADGSALSILADLSGAASVTITSFVRVRFHITFLDPFVSVLISAMIFAMTVNQMRSLIRISLQGLLDTSDSKLIMMEASEWTSCNAWLMNEDDMVLTMEVEMTSAELEALSAKIATPLERCTVTDVTIENHGILRHDEANE